MKRRPCEDAATLEVLVASWLEQYESPHTRAAYRTDLQHFRRWSAAHGVSPFALEDDHFRSYRAACEAEGAGPATVARRLSALASFATRALGESTVRVQGRIDRPTVAASSSTGSLSDRDAVALLAAADQISLRSGLVVRLLMLDGLKVGEAVRADAGDVAGRPPRMTLTLRDATPRVIDLDPDTAALVAAYLGTRRHGPLLLSEHRAYVNERLTRFGVDYVVKQTADAAGFLRSVSANTLRRRFVVAAHERGDDLDTIRNRAGHSDARTTRRYLDDARQASRDRTAPDV